MYALSLCSRQFLHIRLSLSLPRLSIRTSACLPACLSVCLSVCLSCLLARTSLVCSSSQTAALFPAGLNDTSESVVPSGAAPGRADQPCGLTVHRRQRRLMGHSAAGLQQAWSVSGWSAADLVCFGSLQSVWWWRLVRHLRASGQVVALPGPAELNPDSPAQHGGTTIGTRHRPPPSPPRRRLRGRRVGRSWNRGPEMIH